ncbi:hypothetical protein AMS68_000750 [Peltaster fructicola]|uniref:Very-long-chain (3R)-3-hydroxyacyl-CoA dehydratase n=1 Tax=Peltaster fructicola TaxID=286661 RepID=A0A6H0XKI3_9PEZI|nr:hypothetical protein AMS68_000750 [Peltaster fructicola]
MNRPQDSQLPTKSTSGDTTRKTPGEKATAKSKNYYLIAYNFVSAGLWAVVLGRTVLLATTRGYAVVYPELFEYVKYVQTLAVLEILHAAAGIVRTPLITTAMQVASRLLLVWGIGQFFQSTTMTSPAFSTMLLAWSATEVVRYTYFALIISLDGGVPAFLTWLRYNLFFVLYPLGISSECWLVYRSIEPARLRQPGLEYALITVLLIYVPGSYVLFTHMMAQRRKTMRSLKGSKKSQ